MIVLTLAQAVFYTSRHIAYEYIAPATLFRRSRVSDHMLNLLIWSAIVGSLLIIWEAKRDFMRRETIVMSVWIGAVVVDGFLM